MGNERSKDFEHPQPGSIPGQSRVSCSGRAWLWMLRVISIHKGKLGGPPFCLFLGPYSSALWVPCSRPVVDEQATYTSPCILLASKQAQDPAPCCLGVRILADVCRMSNMPTFVREELLIWGEVFHRLVDFTTCQDALFHITGWKPVLPTLQDWAFLLSGTNSLKQMRDTQKGQFTNLQ